MRRAPKLVFQLTIPPTIMLVLWGYALNPEVKNLPTAVLDADRTPASRDLLASITELEAFDVTAHYVSAKDLEQAFEDRAIDVGIVIPPGFARDLEQSKPAQVQVLIDAVAANSATVAGGYLLAAVGDYNDKLIRRRLAVSGNASAPRLGRSEVRAVAMFNPGMVFSWFYVTAIMGVVLFVDGSLVASAIAVREKEVGTIEQLLMSPAQSLEILLAKTTPMLVLLVLGLMVSTYTAHLVFGLPLRGSFWLYLFSGVMASFAAMGMGILLATYSNNQQQAQLLTFFVNPVVMLCSGAFARIDNMPWIFQAFSYVDPLRYLVEIIRGITIKGVGLELLWRPIGSLAVLTVLLYAASVWRFRRQLR